jgi:hypothetical protein
MTDDKENVDPQLAPRAVVASAQPLKPFDRAGVLAKLTARTETTVRVSFHLSGSLSI